MKDIIALQSEELKDGCRIADSKGREVVSGDPCELLAFIADHDNDAFKIVHDLTSFLKPIKQLLPNDVMKKLYNEEKVNWQGFKLFYPDIKGGLFGVNHKDRVQLKGNFYEEIKHDITLYDIAGYYPGDKPESIGEVKDKGINLLRTLQHIGLEPERLTSVAAIYESCVLSKLPFATIYNLPDTCLPMMEWAENYIREWRSVYKIGIFEHGQAKDFDLSSAYPSIIAGLPNMTGAEFHYSDNGQIPDSAEWGLVWAEIDVKADISFLVSDDGICRRGKRIDLISKEEIDYCLETGKASIEPIEGWYFTVPRKSRIFDYSMSRLYQMRQGNGLQSRIAKAASVSVWGKFHQMIGDVPGEYCNFIYASMVASRCRLKVMQFIDDNQLHDDLISVTVDGCIATKDIRIPTVKEFGKWRQGEDSEAIILDSNFQWIGNKRQLGITASELIAEIKAHPAKQDWHNVYLALLEQDRLFQKFPRNGYDLLKQVYNSEAFKTK